MPYKKFLAGVLAVAIALIAPVRSDSQTTPARPVRLVLLIAIDQFRYDYLTRYRAEYHQGFDRLLRNGANYVNANLEHFPSVTAIGHSTMLSGATPQSSGIVGNEWFDRESGKAVSSVSDDTVKPLGGSATTGASPRRLLVSTVGDEMKRAHGDHPKVIGISLKDRAAILPAGHMADASYWYDSKTGAFASSTYYFPQMPEWIQNFNAKQLFGKYAGVEWRFGPGAEDTAKMPAEIGAPLAGAISTSPFASELLEQLAEETVSREKLGQRGTTDLLTVSFSSNDSVGHKYGPDASRSHDMCLRTDRILGKLFAFLEKSVGMQHVLVVLTADHGVAPLPEQLQQEQMPGGRLTSATLVALMRDALDARFGKAQWFLRSSAEAPYLDLKIIQEKKLDRAEVERVAANAVADAPHIARVYTREQLLHGEVSGDRFSERIVRSFNARRSGDLVILQEPYWIAAATGAEHGTPYSYDSHIPIIFMGPGIKAGRYVRSVALNDVAPSLATILDIETPSGSVGNVLFEMLAPTQKEKP